MINQEHYKKGKIQPIEFITSNEMNFLEGNIIKYVTRYKYKNGLEDLMKAKDYLDRLIKENHSLITKENIKSMEKEIESHKETKKPTLEEFNNIVKQVTKEIDEAW